MTIVIVIEINLMLFVDKPPNCSIFQIDVTREKEYGEFLQKVVILIGSDIGDKIN